MANPTAPASKQSPEEGVQYALTGLTVSDWHDGKEVLLAEPNVEGGKKDEQQDIKNDSQSYKAIESKHARVADQAVVEE
jgi:hypothetical protein